mgnify:CR=1 FL=1
MPEFKHNFTGGKMNKDVNQRLVPKGEYRNAMNIQVSTSEESDVGTVQNILGNSLVQNLNINNNSKCIGSVADEKNDALYWFVSEPPAIFSFNTSYSRDIIFELKNGQVKHVVVDIKNLSVPIYSLQAPASGNLLINDQQNFNNLNVGDTFQIYQFINGVGQNISGNDTYTILSTDPGNLTVNIGDYTETSWANIQTQGPGELQIVLTSENNVLNFQGNIITGINIIDDMLFWTDNYSEPKKINIPRSIEGTNPNGQIQTRLINEERNIDYNDAINLQEKHVTVIRKGPNKAPTISSVTSFRDGDIFGNITNSVGIFSSNGTQPLPVGHEKWIAINGDLNYEPGDILRFSSNPQQLAPEYFEIRATVLQIEQGPYSIGAFNSSSGQTAVKIEIESMSADGLTTSINPLISDWSVGLEEIGKTLFEQKLPRFSTRYRYIDGEYSNIGPFTEVVFIPGNFRYHPREAYNTGMVNRLRDLTIQDFIPNDIPEDVVQVDILYKNEVSPNIYVVETISRQDTLDSNNENAWTRQGSSAGLRGSYKISSENIYATLPENQLLRSWDNVPRKALAQEVTGNRIVYGNYTQNYNIKEENSNEVIKPSIRTVIGGRVNEDDSNIGKKSIKSMRTYDIGLVWGDKYGRETPIITPSSGSTIVPKARSTRANMLNVEVSDKHPDWADYYKIFVKETSNEYYNLAMDRLYDAEDGNVWISFPSIDRNKVDEDTYIILKKGIDTEDAIVEEARYKIVAIENEAPEYIKTSYDLLAQSVDDAGAVIHSAELYGGNDPTAAATLGDSGLPSSGQSAPIPGAKSFSIDIERWTSEWFAGNAATNTPSNMGLPRLDKLFTDLKLGAEEMWVDFIRADDDDLANPVHGTSGRYRITQLLLDDPDQDFSNSTHYEIKIHRPIAIEDGFITDDLNVGNDFVRVRFWKKSIENLPQFDGRFFVKILRDNIVDEKLVNYVTTVRNWTITSSTTFHRIKDSSLNQSDPLSFYQLYQPLNSYPTSPTSTGNNPPINNSSSTRSASDWATLLKFGGTQLTSKWFIDGASFASVMPGTSRDINAINDTQNIGNSVIETCDTTSTINYTFNGTGNCVEAAPTTGSENTGNGLSRAVLGMKGVHDSGGNHYFDFAYSVIGPNTSGSQTNFTVGEDDGNNPTNSFTDQEEQIVSRLGVNERFKIEGDPTIYRILGVQKRRLFNFRGVPTTPAPERENCTVPCPTYNSNCDFQGCNDGQYDECCDCPNQFVTYNDYFVASNYYSQEDQMHANYNRRKTYRIQYEVDQLSLPNPDITVAQNGWSETLPDNPAFASVYASGVDASSSTTATIQFVSQFDSDLPNLISNNPAIFETEPKEDVDLDIYYEATGSIPTRINVNNRELYIPIGATLEFAQELQAAIPSGIFVTQWQGLNSVILSTSLSSLDFQAIEQMYPEIKFVRDDGSYLEVTITGSLSSGSVVYGLTFNPLNFGKIGLNWFNCWSFNNGVESNRIGDTYNKPYIVNGVKASSVIIGDYEEEERTNGLIYSGIYNPNSNTNNLNQFITAEKITKDINPTYGSIQKLYSRSTADGDLITLCEDRVLKILANKDAVFNADGNTQLTATNKVLGQAIPYAGDYGISKNPESFAAESYRAYFSDKVRGTILRLSKDGLTPISFFGMKDWFRDNLKLGDNIIGSYDDRKDEYNVTIKGGVIDKTVTFKEDVKGWVSFKSFTPENAISCANEYYTFKDGSAWKHHDETANRNTFYSENLVPSTLEVVFNEIPGSVKSFKTINYEGSQAKVTSKDENGVTLVDGEYFNLTEEKGWYVQDIVTNLEQGGITEFIKKEGKWFGYVTGNDVTYTVDGDISGNYDTEDFSIQGIGVVSSVVSSIVYGCTDPTMYNYNDSATNDDGSCLPHIYGCTDSTSDNYNSSATTDDGSCVWYGCTQGPLADWTTELSGTSTLNYNPIATVDDGSCIPAIYGCTISGNFNYDPLANFGSSYLSDGTLCGYVNCMCIPFIYGCTDPNASNYFSPNSPDDAINTDDGSCLYSGCTDPLAENYSFMGSTVDSNNGSFSYLNGTAVDDGSCTYIGGCMDSTACNYDATATQDDGSCYYCGDTNAVNYDAPFSDASCTSNCVYCEPPTSLMVLSNTTSDANLNNGTVTLQWPVSPTASEYYIYANNSPIAGPILPSGNNIETYTVTGLATGTYNFMIFNLCVSTQGATLISYDITGPISGPTATSTITSTPIPGCTDNTGVNNNIGAWGACNYNPAATVDDGSCVYDICIGCTDPSYLEYCGDCWDPVNLVAVASGGNPWVADDGSCSTIVVNGCTDSNAFNYDPNANVDDGSCIAVVLGCTDSTLNYNGTYAASNYDPLANTDDGSCLPYNCPFGPNVILTGNDSIQVSFGIGNTPFSGNINTGGFPNDFTLGLIVSDNNNNAIFADANLGGFSTINNTIFSNINPSLVSSWTQGQTSITVIFTVNSNNGTCSISQTETFSVGCLDTNADNSGTYDLEDNTQCIYTGCMDATMNPDGNQFAADNYDPNANVPCNDGTGDNSCCVYTGTPSTYLTPTVTSSSSPIRYTILQLTVDYLNTPYSDVQTNVVSLGTGTNTQVYSGTIYTSWNQTNMGNPSGTENLPLPLFQGDWTPYINNNGAYGLNSGDLTVTISSTWTGTIDNASQNNTITTNVQETHVYTAGCKNGDSSHINYDPNLDFHIDNSCVDSNPGCMSPTATNYNSAFNQDCTATGSTNATDCCCYTCDTPTFETSFLAVNASATNSSGNVYATQITFSFAAVSTAASYTITVTDASGISLTINNFVPTSISNGVASYVYYNNGTNWFLDESSYTFEIIANCENGDGNSCGSSTSDTESNFTINI